MYQALNFILIFSMILTALGPIDLRSTRLDDYEYQNDPRIEHVFIQEPPITETPPVETIVPSDTPVVMETPLETETPEASATPTAEPTVTDTVEPTNEPTVDATETPTQQPTSEVTAEPTAEPTAITTPEPTGTPTIAPTVEPTQTVTANKQSLGLTLTSTSYDPGEPLAVQWAIDGATSLPSKTPWLLRFILPSGIEPVAPENGKFDPQAGTFVLPLSAMKDELVFKTTAGIGIAEIYAELLEGETVLCKAALVLAGKDTKLVKKDGGEANGLGGKVKVKFPKDALLEDVGVTIQEPKVPAPAGPYTIGKPFELTADGVTSKAKIHKFEKEVEIEIQYDPATIGIHPSKLALYFYDEARQTWMMVPTVVDQKNNRLRAYSKHFSQWTAGEHPWDMKVQPLDAAQVSSFTGSASYSYPINVPQGPGGLTPSVSLNYNSQSVEGVGQKTQASWVGLGWQLSSGGAIMRNKGEDMDRVEDDTFSLDLGGSSYSLVPISKSAQNFTKQGTDGNTYTFYGTIDYKTTDDNFFRIRRYVWFRAGATGDYARDFDFWVIWDKSGTKHVFDYRPYYVEKHEEETGESCPGTGPCITMRPWGWYLTSTINPHGQVLSYTYNNERSMKCPQNDCGYSAFMDTAVYPKEILYPDGVTKIEFGTDTQRQDVDYYWDDLRTLLLYQRMRLVSIIVRVNGEIIKQYDLTHRDKNAAVQLLPGSKWHYDVTDDSKIGHVLTLDKIQEKGIGGNSFPAATTFTYGNDMFLTEVNNGQAGRVKFTYEGPGGAAPWHATEGIEGQNSQVNYETTGRVIQSYPTALLGTIGARAGGAYKVSCEVKNAGTTDTKVKYSIKYTNIDKNESAEVTVAPGSSYTEKVEYVYIPGKAEKAEVYIEHVNNSGPGVYFNTCYAVPVVAHHRVLTKTLYDGTGASFNWNYAYTGAAVNDTAHSDIANLDSAVRLSKNNSEFRGHNFVTETDPNGRITETVYNQWDGLNGRVYRVRVYKPNYGGRIMVSENYTYISLIQSTYFNTTFCAKTGWAGACYQDQKVFWLRTDWESSKTFKDDGAYQGTKKEYSYETSLQNGVQYGNVTHTVLSTSDNSTTWKDHRLDVTQYYPNASVPDLLAVQASAVLPTWVGFSSALVDNDYITGLPGWMNTYPCATTNGECFDSGDPLPAASTVLSSKMFYYDLSETTIKPSDFKTAPQGGVPTGQRTFLYNDGSGIPHYQDEGYQYDTYGNRTKTVMYQAEGLKTPDTAAYFGISTTEVPSQITTYEYDSTFHARLTKTTNALGHTVTNGYAAGSNAYRCGRPSSVTDANNNVTSLEYDNFCRLTKVIRPGDSSGSPTIQYSYTDTYPSSVFVTARVTAGSTTDTYQERNFYNGLGRLIQKQVANAEILEGSTVVTRDLVTDYLYNAYGSVVKQTVPYSSPTGSGMRAQDFTKPNTQNTYDALGRVTVTLLPDASSTSTTYNGNETTVRDAKNQATRQVVNELGLLVEVHPPLDPWTRYTYDQMDRMIKAEQMKNTPPNLTVLATTTLTYDNAGRKNSMADPDMGTWNYIYDAVGNLTQQTDARGCITTLTYDLLNRLKTKVYSGTPASCDSTPDVSITYDLGTNGKGQRTDMASGTASSEWMYDTRGRVIMEVKTISGIDYTTQWTYNSVDLPVSMMYPSNEQVNYTYNRQLDLKSVTGSSTYLQQALYDAEGRMVKRTLGSSLLTTKFEYYPWATVPTDNGYQKGGRLWDTETGAAPNFKQKLTYSYDPNGNVLSIIDGRSGVNETLTYAYDANNRLDWMKVNGATTDNPTYDTYGRLSQKGTGTNIVYNASGHIHAASSMTGGRSFVYDANGNMTTRVIGGVTYILTYDAENRLTGYSGTGTTAAFVYDGDGKRVMGTVNGVKNVYVGNHYEVEGEGTAAKIRRYYFAETQRIAMRETASSTNTLYFFLSDHLGSTAITIKADGTFHSELRYGAWGDTRYQNGTTPTSRRFTGQAAEESLGIYFYEARWYDSFLNRWIQPDTIIPYSNDPISWDRYAYAGNNPIHWT